MTSDIEAKRTAIKKAYPHSDQWAAKVDKMPDSQVLAVHSRLMNKGREAKKRIQAQRRAQ